MEERSQSEYTYYAFISYKREDEKWAKWLQRKLESYGFPVGLRKDNPALPSKIRPVFRDQSDLSGGNLKAAIERGLRESKYLIVICSPRSAQSPWVSREVQYFIDNERGNYIIPFIIDGIPNAKNPEKECFPEGLRQLSGEKEILGININEMGRDAAAIKVIARMFDLRFDSLWQRHKKAQRRKNIIIGIICVILTSVIVGGYLYFKPNCEYYGEIDLKLLNGQLTVIGLESLKKDEINDRYISYRFTYTRHNLSGGRKLSKIEKIDAAFRPTDNADVFLPLEGQMIHEWPIITIDYNDSGRPYRFVGYDKNLNNKISYNISYQILKDDILVLIDIKRINQSEANYGDQIENRTIKSNAKRYSYKTDELGNIVQINYHSHSGSLKDSRTMNNSRVFGYVIIRDSKTNKIVQVQAIDNDDRIMSDVYNTSITKFEHDSIGRVEEISYYDESMNPIINNLLGYHKEKVLYDKRNNIIETSCFDVNSNPSINKYGYSIQSIEYREGKPIKIAYFDKFGQPMNDVIHKIHCSHLVYDKDKNLIKETFYDKDCNIAPNITGASIIYYEYDKLGNCILTNYRNNLNEPIIAKGLGYSTVKKNFNSKGQVIEAICLDKSNKPILNIEGYYKQTNHYDQMGNLTKCETFDTNGNLVNGKFGCAIIQSKTYDDINGGSWQEISYYDNDEKPCVNSSINAHKILIRFDENGNMTSQFYYDSNDSYCANIHGFAIGHHSYDKYGRIIKSSYLHVDSLPTYYLPNINESEFLYSHVAGFYSDSTVYISNNDFIKYYKVINDSTNAFDKTIIVRQCQNRDTLKTTYYDSNFRTCLGPKGYSSRVVIYNEYLIPKEISFLDKNLAACEIEGGLFKCSYKFDERHNVIETSYYNKYNKITSYSGASYIRQLYDGRDRLIESMVFDDAGEPICINGFHKKKIQYDDRDNISQITFYDVSDNQILNSECFKYDDSSNLTSLSYKNIAGDLENNKDGIALISYRYNTLGQLAKIEYRNSDLKYAISDNNCSVQINRYNNKNLLKSSEYYDNNNKCIGKYDFVYDNRNRPTEVNVSDFFNKKYYKAKQILMVTKNDKNYVLVSLYNWDLSQPIDEYIRNLLWLNVNRNIEVYDIATGKIAHINLSIEDNVSGQIIPISMHDHIRELLEDVHKVRNFFK